MLDGREMILSIGRYSLLEYWHNPLFDRSNPAPITETQAMGELMLVMHATKDELQELQRMPPEKRRDSVLAFMLAHDDEIGELAEGIQERLKSTEAAAVEIDDLGKHQDNPPA